jgi:chromosome segregation ATPase
MELDLVRLIEFVAIAISLITAIGAARRIGPEMRKVIAEVEKIKIETKGVEVGIEENRADTARQLTETAAAVNAQLKALYEAEAARLKEQLATLIEQARVHADDARLYEQRLAKALEEKRKTQTEIGLLKQRLAEQQEQIDEVVVIVGDLVTQIRKLGHEPEVDLSIISRIQKRYSNGAGRLASS